MGYVLVEADKLNGVDFGEPFEIKKEEVFSKSDIQRIHCFSIPESLNEKNPQKIKELNKKLYYATKKHVEQMMEEDC